MTLTSSSFNDSQIIYLDDLTPNSLGTMASFKVEAMLNDPVTIHVELDHYKQLKETTRQDNYASLVNVKLL